MRDEIEDDEVVCQKNCWWWVYITIAYLFDWAGIASDARLLLFRVLMINVGKEFILNGTGTIDFSLLAEEEEEKKVKVHFMWYERVKKAGNMKL